MKICRGRMETGAPERFDGYGEVAFLLGMEDINNWASGMVGSTALSLGHNNENINNSPPPSTADGDPYSGGLAPSTDGPFSRSRGWMAAT